MKGRKKQPKSSDTLIIGAQVLESDKPHTLQNCYKVTWTIDMYADSPEEAARGALEIMQDRESTATVFDVEEENENHVTVDLK